MITKEQWDKVVEWSKDYRDEDDDGRVQIGEWDGGNDSGEVSVQRIAGVIDPLLAEKLEKVIDSKLGYGSWAGGFQSTGNVFIDPSDGSLILQGGEMDYEAYVPVEGAKVDLDELLPKDMGVGEEAFKQLVAAIERDRYGSSYCFHEIGGFFKNPEDWAEDIIWYWDTSEHVALTERMAFKQLCRAVADWAARSGFDEDVSDYDMLEMHVEAGEGGQSLKVRLTPMVPRMRDVHLVLDPGDFVGIEIQEEEQANGAL